MGEKTKKQGMLGVFMLQKTPTPQNHNPLVGITIFLFIYLLIKPVPQLVSGRGRWKKREKKTRTQWKIIEKCSNSGGGGGKQ